MRTTLDHGRDKQCARFVMDVDTGTMIECPFCMQQQMIPVTAVPNTKPYFCNHADCGKELFYPGWAEW